MKHMYDKAFFERLDICSCGMAYRIAEILDSMYSLSSVIDLGCGAGIYLRPFIERGYRVKGIEPSLIAKEVSGNSSVIECADLTEILYMEQYDIALCLEVAEHIEQESIEMLFDNLTRPAPVIVFSAAIPGQPGDGHINCQAKDYWLELFEFRGYDLDVQASEVFMQELERGHYLYWVKQNLMIVKRRDI